MTRTAAFCTLLLIAPLAAQDTQQAEIRPEQDDASLRSVFFTTADNGCAVGENGVIKVTRDGGLTWQFKRSPVSGLNEFVTFVNGKTGWIVGSQTQRGANIPLGYVLRTEDGGETWKTIAGKPSRRIPGRGPLRYLPRLRHVRFFTTKLGFAVGQANRFYPSGVLKTTDGGLTWEPVAGDAGSWRCAWFMNPDTGFLAGRLMSQGGMRGEKVVVDANASGGSQTWRSMFVRSTSPSWMVGDGAQVLFSNDAGITWQEPARSLPRSLRDFCDFNTVAAQGDRVWIAGSPGSVVWHSPDAGRTWTRQPTGMTVAIRSLFFRDANTGWAVGDLGLIAKTADGGSTWQVVSGQNRHTALLCASPRSARVPFAAVAKYAGEQGYRTAVLLPVREDAGANADTTTDIEDQLRESTTAAFGSIAEQLWRFPVGVAGADHVDRQLVADWQIRTEGKFGSTMLSALVAKIRTLKPSVIVLDEVAPDDAVARIINEAITRAAAQAGDPNAFPDHLKLAGLQPWKVEKIFRRTPAGSRAAIEIADHDLLRLRATTVGAVRSAAFARLGRTATPGGSSGFRRVVPQLTEGTVRAEFFRGLGLAPGTASRRNLLTYDESANTVLTEVAKLQQNLDGYTRKLLADERMANQLLAQLDEFTATMPDKAAAQQLQKVANRYVELQKWNLAAATMLKLARTYPRTPEASDAREWLIHWWAAEEPSWQRMRRSGFNGEQKTSTDKIDQIASKYPNMILPASYESVPDTFGVERMSDGQTEHRSRLTANWRESALRLAAEMKSTDPLRYQSVPVQLSLASLMRRRDDRAKALRLYGDLGNDSWQRAAENELWADQMAGTPPQAFYTLRKTSVRPRLDAMLSDECWQAAKEQWLRGDRLDGRKGSYTAMAYDDQFLYLAGRVARHSSTASVKSGPGKRTYDADLGKHDRVTFCFDTDRDYATWYRLEIDQRGQTTDSCWLNRDWNPKWFVAIDSDESHWRFEAAIPLEELTGRPAKNQTWAVGVSRFLPGHGTSGWNSKGSEEPKPQTFGLLKFGR